MGVALNGSELVATFAFDPVIGGLGPLQLGLHGVFSALATAVVAAAAYALAGPRGGSLRAEPSG
jgi:hypothetical protein